MKKISLWVLLLAVLAFTGCSDNDDDEQNNGKKNSYVLKLPTYSLETEYIGDTENPVKTWEEGSGEYAFPCYQTLLTDESKFFNFDCVSTSYGIYSGFEFTNLTSGDKSSITKKGVSNNTYVTAYYNTSDDYGVAIKFKQGDYNVKGLYVTNSLAAYTSISEGDNFSREFQNGDWYKVTIYNMDKTENVEFYLADYQNNKTEIVTEWKWVDLTSLGETNGLRFELSSTDNNEYGMRTPAYFCIDGITIEEK
ncbi:MAG: DUF4465 domain-containing protein [Bacteroides sp.]|nr:DUF4465 domain-containing protein [Bacteroides sp.]